MDILIFATSYYTYKNQFIVVIKQYFGSLGITRLDSGK